MKKLSYERFIWFHQRIKERGYPNATSLSRHFEVCRKTAQRDIDFFKDRLSAPLKYSPARRGYYYTDDTFELPAFWLKKEEIIALLFAKRLAASIPDKDIKASLDGFLDKLTPVISSQDFFDHLRMEDKISLQNVEYFSVDDVFFKDVINALFRQRALEIRYYSPYEDKETRRVVVPLHLLNYMGSWYVVAWCDARKDLRIFVLSRIKSVKEAGYLPSMPNRLPDIKKYCREHFGIFSGRRGYRVVLRFSREASRWVQDQIWHKAQKMEWDTARRLILSVSVTDFREIKREILKFGSEVEVLQPQSLREDIKEEIKKMKKVYT